MDDFNIPGVDEAEKALETRVEKPFAPEESKDDNDCGDACKI